MSSLTRRWPMADHHEVKQAAAIMMSCGHGDDLIGKSPLQQLEVAESLIRNGHVTGSDLERLSAVVERCR